MKVSMLLLFLISELQSLCLDVVLENAQID